MDDHHPLRRAVLVAASVVWLLPTANAAGQVACGTAESPTPLSRLEGPDLAAGAAPAEGNLEGWVNTLADPSLRGRRAGSAESRQVARLIADAFADFGLRAPFEGGDYCQPFEVALEAGDLESVVTAIDQNVVGHTAGLADQPHTPPPPAEATGSATSQPSSRPLVVIGAHYDGLGVDETGRIYPGADDNASGVAVLLELARLIGRDGPDLGVDVVFVAFGAEEQWLVGSSRFVSAPTVPLDRVDLMINLDMLSRPLLDGHWARAALGNPENAIGYVLGSVEADATRTLLYQAAEATATQVIGVPEWLLESVGFGADSMVFSPQVPTLFFSTSVHDDYHAVTDTPDKIDVSQMVRGTELVLAVLRGLGRRE